MKFKYVGDEPGIDGRTGVLLLPGQVVDIPEDALPGYNPHPLFEPADADAKKVRAASLAVATNDDNTPEES